jgi:hypothetical protein
MPIALVDLKSKEKKNTLYLYGCQERNEWLIKKGSLADLFWKSCNKVVAIWFLAENHIYRDKKGWKATKARPRLSTRTFCPDR